jgi:hypothetical protein
MAPRSLEGRDAARRLTWVILAIPLQVVEQEGKCDPLASALRAVVGGHPQGSATVRHTKHSEVVKVLKAPHSLFE